MSKDLAHFWNVQKSLTEWLDEINHNDASAIRREDNDKRERLKVLNRTIGLPFDEPVQFEAADIKNKTPAFQEYLRDSGDELCALRLMPKTDDLPKLRMRGKSVKQAYEWFFEQAIDASQYRADFVPHAEKTNWATIFIVNKHGFYGEITAGGHHELTQGFHESATPHVFKYDFQKWQVIPDNQKALAHVKKLASYLLVPNKAKQALLRKELDSTFANDYLEGYFESTDSEAGVWFIDYNQTLGRMYEDFVINSVSGGEGLVKGLTGSPGKAEGPVKIVDPDKIKTDEFPAGGVLVCAVTTPNYVPLMQKASAIVTDQGGILSHAAIVARELKVPCIVGTGKATKVLKNGQSVSVDADSGIVTAA